LHKPVPEHLFRLCSHTSIPPVLNEDGQDLVSPKELYQRSRIHRRILLRFANRVEPHAGPIRPHYFDTPPAGHETNHTIKVPLARHYRHPIQCAAVNTSLSWQPVQRIPRALDLVTNELSIDYSE